MPTCSGRIAAWYASATPRSSSGAPNVARSLGYGQGFANPGVTYHPLPQCGGNFSFVIDYGGQDTYGCGAENNTYNQRGAIGGFLIDRPLKEEAAEQARQRAIAKPKPEDAGQKPPAGSEGTRVDYQGQ